MSQSRPDPKGNIGIELVYQTALWRFHVDYTLLLLFGLFSIVSCLILYDGSGDYGLIKKHLINYTIALMAFVLIAQIPSIWIRLSTPYLYVLGILLLLLVFVIGVEGKGAQRWISLGALNLQPAELFKILLPMGLAWWFNCCSEYRLSSLKVWSMAVFILITPGLLIALQPDLGSALMITSGGVIVIFLAGIPRAAIGLGLASVASSMPFIWSSLHEYQKQRIWTFLDPYQDPLGSGYHIIQSQIAIGSGGMTGKGWNQGSQTQLDFLPEHHTDFIFSAIAESFGLVGSLAIIILFFMLCYYGISIAKKAQTTYLRLLSATLSLLIFFYTFVNVAMVMGLLPVVGLPLPFISYGGSSLLTYSIILGILSSIKHQRTSNQPAKPD